MIEVIVCRPKLSASNATMEWLRATVPLVGGMEVVQNHRETNVGIGGLTGSGNGELVATSESIGALQAAAKRMRQGIARAAVVLHLRSRYVS